MVRRAHSLCAPNNILYERAYILATESFYKIQARPVAMFTGRILSPRNQYVILNGTVRTSL